MNLFGHMEDDGFVFGLLWLPIVVLLCLVLIPFIFLIILLGYGDQ